MTSVKNLSSLGSIAIHTLREGSITERVVLGTALFATGALLVYKIFQVASRFFAKAVLPVAVPRFEQTPEEAAVKRRDLEAKYPLPAFAPRMSNAPPSHPAPQEVKSHSMLSSVTINGLVIPQEMEVRLAEALHLYQELKTKLGVNEDCFVFLATTYLQNGVLLAVVEWEKTEPIETIEVKIPSYYNDAFGHLEGALKLVGLSLKDVKRSDLALAQFKDGTSKEIKDLADLYQTIKLQGPQILGSFEVKIKEHQVFEAKVQLHKSRLNIIDKTLSTLRAVFIEDFVKTFGVNHKQLYTIVGSNPQTLHFVLENICWHAL
ncbi:MAG TPA: hypothetical protein VIJ14_04280, partial [Rhabdochlamydiaceae bacterium]